jgi:hypothetical protein
LVVCRVSAGIEDSLFCCATPLLYVSHQQPTYI